MLVLTRQFNEGVTIGPPDNPIGRVVVVAVRGDKVRLGFEFDRDVPVHRDEVVAEIVQQSEQGRAA